jgi:DNA-binding response OmpR family regulator
MEGRYDVIVTDYDDDVRGFMAEALTYEGYRVLSLPSGSLTPQAITAASPSVLIVDLQGQTLDLLVAMLNRLTQGGQMRDLGVIFTALEASHRQLRRRPLSHLGQAV